MADHHSSIDIAASPDAVFAHLVTAEGLTGWLGRWAEIEPSPGGRFAVDIAGYAVRGEVVEIDRPHRLTLTWGFTGDADVPPGSSTVVFTLTGTADGTRVDLLHTGLPDAALAGHADGWAHFVPRLASAAVGRPPATDTWRPLTRPDGTPEEITP